MQLANVEAQIGAGAYRSDRLPRSHDRRRTGWLTTFALILAEALLAIALVIVGVTLFAKVKIASETLGDLRAAGPLLVPRLMDRPVAEPVQVPQVPLSDRRVDTIVAIAESPAAKAAAPPAAISIVGRGDVAAFGGNAVAIVAEAQIVPPPIVLTIATPAAVEELRSAAAQPPGASPVPAERSDTAPETMPAPGAEPGTPVAIPEPRHAAAAALEPPALPPAATEVTPEETAPITKPGPVVATAAVSDPANVRSRPAAKHRHIAKKPQPRVHVAAKRPRVHKARASVTPTSTSPTGYSAPRSTSASTTPASLRYFQER